MIYRVVPYTYLGVYWRVERKSFLFWWSVATSLDYEEAVDVVEKMIERNGGMWEATAKRKV